MRASQKGNCYSFSRPKRRAMSGYKFIDLFCGIGGMRLGFERTGCECLFSSGWDKYANLTYEANFGEKPVGDISSDRIPDHDILLAGFPCQPFSISGVSKKNSLGRARLLVVPIEHAKFRASAPEVCGLR
jgi:DNA-cytosine methyltransferase